MQAVHLLTKGAHFQNVNWQQFRAQDTVLVGVNSIAFDLPEHFYLVALAQSHSTPVLHYLVSRRVALLTDTLVWPPVDGLGVGGHHLAILPVEVREPSSQS